MKTQILSILILLTITLSCNSQKEINSPNNQWHLVYKNDEKGKTVFGDKLQLIDAVRLGYPIKIGWGGMS